jgi:hypothetical protein
MIFPLMTSGCRRDGVFYRKSAPSFDRMGQLHLLPTLSVSGYSRALEQTPSSVKSCNSTQILTMPIAPIHSVATRSGFPAKILTHLLSACHSLDLAICSASPSQITKIQSWHKLEIIAYLTSNDILKTWETNLELLGRAYDEGAYTLEGFEGMLKGMLPSVDSLGASRDQLLVLCKGERNGSGDNGRVLQEVYEGAEKRCKILERAFNGLERKLR